MPTNRILALALAALATLAAGVPSAWSQLKSTNEPAEAKPPAKKSQSEVASKTAAFGKTSKSGEAYKAALDAHALDLALKEVDKEGAFKGTVTAVFEPRNGSLAILNFDKNYRTALTALVKNNDFDKFPDLKTLIGKEVLVTGKFISFQGRAEIALTNAAQIKLVETTK